MKRHQKRKKRKQKISLFLCLLSGFPHLISTTPKLLLCLVQPLSLITVKVQSICSICSANSMHALCVQCSHEVILHIPHHLVWCFSEDCDQKDYSSPQLVASACWMLLGIALETTQTILPSNQWLKGDHYVVAR